MLANRRQFFIRQQAALFQLAGAYDILDPASQKLLATAVEVPPGWASLLRLLVSKGFLPTMVEVRETGQEFPCLSLHKRAAVLRHRVTVRDHEGRELGSFATPAFSFRHRLILNGPDGVPLAELVGDWKGWDFTFISSSGAELGRVTKKWAGLGKELFTTADSYMISLAEDLPASGDLATLLLTAGLAIDLTLKEHAG